MTIDRSACIKSQAKSTWIEQRIFLVGSLRWTKEVVLQEGVGGKEELVESEDFVEVTEVGEGEVDIVSMATGGHQVVRNSV